MLPFTDISIFPTSLEHDNSELFNKFKLQMSHKLDPVSFSLNFCHVATVDFGNKAYFRDVKVANRCIVLSDSRTNHLLFIDLKPPYNIIQNLKTPDSPHYLCIEKIKNGSCCVDEFLYVSFQFYVYKFHLESLLNGKCEIVWRSGEFTPNLQAQQISKPPLHQFHYPQGMIVCKYGDLFRNYPQYNESILLVCDQVQFEIKVVQCNNGKVIARLDTRIPIMSMKGCGPVCIELDSNGRIFTSGSQFTVFSSLETDSNGQAFEKGTSLSNVGGFVIDKVSGNVLISDQGNKRIVVLNSDGQFIKEYNQLLQNPSSICIDDRNGYVYISDESKIHILK